MTNNLGRCKFCGSENVRNPKTGKVFCSEKCWLKNKPNEFGSYPQKKETNWPEIRKEKKEDIRDNVVLKESVNIVLRMYEKGEVSGKGIIQMVEQVFNQLKSINQNGNEEKYENLE
jgi:uncharacterized Zn finger protein (UPF0148 family)